MPAVQSLSIPFMKMRAAARKIAFATWTIPMALLLLVVLAYGLRALALGFYWDDWPYLWLFHSLGVEGAVTSLAEDRPLLGVLYATCLSLLGTSAIAWQMFALLVHWLYCLGFWWMLSLVWPPSPHKTFWAAALFAVYPGFTQHWIAVIYGQAFLLFSAVFFSMGITLWLARELQAGRRRWLIPGTMLALALSAFCMFSTEYFFGLELLRPVLLWMVFAGTSPPASPAASLTGRGEEEALTPPAINRRATTRPGELWRVARWWLPYLVLMAVFVVWRGFIHTFPGKNLTVVQGLESSGSALDTLMGLALSIMEDLVEGGLVAWGQTMQLGKVIDLAIGLGLRLLALIFGSLVLLWFYLARLRPHGDLQSSKKPTRNPLPKREGARAEPDEQQADSTWGFQALGVGAFAFLASGWPFWITGLEMSMGFPQDRYALPLSVGICLMVAGLVDLLGKRMIHKALLLSVLLALAIGFHYTTSLAYRADWENLRDFLWQLSWRAPGIQPDTLIVTEGMGFRYYEDDSLLAPLNWMYDPDNHSQDMNYLFYDLYVRRNSLQKYDPGLPVEREYRAKTFAGSTSQVLAVYYSPPGCLQVLDPVYDAHTNRLPDRLLRILPLSDPQGLIDPDATAAAPPQEIFGEEPRHRWCYYYEKAELALQQQDWEEIARLKQESINVGIKPDYAAEYLPFIEGLAQGGYWDDAAQMTVETNYWAPSARPPMCAIWERRIKTVTEVDDTWVRALRLVNESLHCGIAERSQTP